MNNPSVIPVLTMNGSSAKIYPFTHEWSVGKSLYYNGQSVGKTNTVYFSATYFPIIWISRAAKFLLKQRSCDHTGTNLFLEAGRHARKNPNSYWPPPPHQKKESRHPHQFLPQGRSPSSAAARPVPPRTPVLPRDHSRAAPFSSSAATFHSRAPPQPALACAPPRPPSRARPPVRLHSCSTRPLLAMRRLREPGCREGRREGVPRPLPKLSQDVVKEQLFPSSCTWSTRSPCNPWYLSLFLLFSARIGRIFGGYSRFPCKFFGLGLIE